ncbi:hypothetical protein BWI17_21575 [Betaproteobacteria bacterium GR16-43]|nr:hypothetical protein BWI17_21575 [Betaproteobacteria bacterium GR16-43]
MKRLLLALALVVILPASPARAADESIAIVADRVYASPTAEPLLKATVIVTAGKIAAVGATGKVKVPPGARVVKAKGMTLLAGYWNSHVHFIDPRVLNAATRPAAELTAYLEDMLTSRGTVHAFEIATLDFGNTLALRERIRKGEVTGPEIYTTGVPFVGPNGTPGYLPGVKLPEFSDPKEVRAFVRKQLDAGADAVKFWSVSPTMQGEVQVAGDVARAAVDEAHRSKKPVFAHPTTVEGVRLAAEYGVDVLAHVSPDHQEGWTPELIALLKSRNVAVTPTMKLFRIDPERQGAPPAVVKQLMDIAGKELGQYSRAGGTILFGTDVGYIPDHDTSEEFALMSKAGLSFAQILASLTTAPAAKFGHAAHTGKVEPGMDADLVLVEGDPKADVSAFSAVRLAMLRGKVIYRAKGF